MKRYSIFVFLLIIAFFAYFMGMDRLKKQNAYAVSTKRFGTAGSVAAEGLTSSCTDAQVLGGDGSGGVECQADSAADDSHNHTSSTLSYPTPSLSDTDGECLSEAPASPVAGRPYCADADNWDPLGRGGTANYLVYYDGANYKGVSDEDGKMLFSSIELPNYAHFASADASYNDTTGDTHDLIAAEVRGGTITNCGATADKVYVLPATAFGFNFMFQVCAAYQMNLQPATGENIWFWGSGDSAFAQLGANDDIVNAADTKGDVMSCWSLETSNGTYELFCKTDNANFVDENP